MKKWNMHTLYSKRDLHVEEISYKSCNNSRNSSCPHIMKCEIMNQSKSNNQNGDKRIKCYGQKLHIAMTKPCRSTKCPSPIGKKSKNWFYQKCDRAGKEIVHIPKLDKPPYEEEIDNEHYGTDGDIAYELYDMLVSVGEMEEKLRHLQIYAHNLAY